MGSHYNANSDTIRMTRTLGEPGAIAGGECVQRQGGLGLKIRMLRRKVQGRRHSTDVYGHLFAGRIKHSQATSVTTKPILSSRLRRSENCHQISVSAAIRFESSSFTLAVPERSRRSGVRPRPQHRPLEQLRVRLPLLHAKLVGVSGSL